VCRTDAQTHRQTPYDSKDRAIEHRAGNLLVAGVMRSQGIEHHLRTDGARWLEFLISVIHSILLNVLHSLVKIIDFILLSAFFTS